MNEIWAVISIAAAAFVATNMDNLLMVTGLLAASSVRGRVVLGYLLSAGVVIALALIIGRLGDFVDARYVGLLGLLPVALGLRGLIRLIRGSSEVSTRAEAVTGVWATVAVILPMSGDSLAVYAPLLADTRPAMDAVIIVTLSLSALAMVSLSSALVARPALRDAIGSAGAWIMPLLMICVGIYVLLDTASDLLVG